MARDEPQPTAVKSNELVDAFEFVSVSQYEEHHAYICRNSGRIIFASDGMEMELDELPDDLDTSDQYLAVPHRRNLDLGSRLALSFVRNELPGSLSKTREIFSRKGAYGRFRQLLRATGALDKWYAYEQGAVEDALRDWCDGADVPLIDG